jgi:hypothetical protein
LERHLGGLLTVDHISRRAAAPPFWEILLGDFSMAGGHPLAEL